MIEINFMDEIPKDICEMAEQEQIKYENIKGTRCNYTPFSLVARYDGNVAGVISGYTCYAEVYIDDIVVLEDYRNLGIGKSMMKAVEDKFADKGFNNMNLVTSEFQAPEFYKKCGFVLEFVRCNQQNPLLTKYFFVKLFNA